MLTDKDELLYHRYQDAAWPPRNGLATQIVPREAVILPTFASITIAAPAPLVWSILRDISAYQSWNTFCPRATIHSQPGDVPQSESESHMLHLNTSFTFHVIMDSGKPSKVTDTQLRGTDYSTPERQSDYVPADTLEGDLTYEEDLGRVWRIAWTTEGGFVARGLKTERFHEIISLDGESGCEVRTWECQGGVLARAVNFYYKDVLMRKFVDWCNDLRKEAESRVRAEENVGR